MLSFRKIENVDINNRMKINNLSLCYFIISFTGFYKYNASDEGHAEAMGIFLPTQHKLNVAKVYPSRLPVLGALSLLILHY